MMPIMQISPRPPLLSLPDIIARELREAIVAGRIVPGQALRQEEIAAQFNSSRIPVREALRQLQAEGLVHITSNKGAVVAVHTEDDVSEFFEIRLLLEPQALRLAIPHHTTDTWQRARDLLDQLDSEHEQNPLGETNRAFHLTLYMPAQRPKLLEIIEGLYRKTDRYGKRTAGLASRHAKAQIEHRRILRDCENRAVDHAAALLTEHITLFGHDLVEYFDSQNS